MPRLRQPDSRTQVAAFRVSPQERRALQASAKKQGLSLSDLLRLTVLGQADGGDKQNA